MGAGVQGKGCSMVHGRISNGMRVQQKGDGGHKDAKDAWEQGWMKTDHQMRGMEARKKGGRGGKSVSLCV